MEYIDTSSIKFDLKIDCNWHAQLQGETPTESMKIQVTAVSSQTEPFVELYALNSKSIPLEDHEGAWSQLIPTWRFLDEDNNVIHRLPIHTHQHPIYTDIVTGEANVKYVDDSPSEIGKPILILATMSLTGYPLDKENIKLKTSDEVITHPGYSNSKITKTHIMEINESAPCGLRISRNGIEPMSAQTYWSNQFIPCVVTVEGWKPGGYDNGDIGNPEKHITIYDYPYDATASIPVTGIIYTKETGIPKYDMETSGVVYGGTFKKYSDEENLFRTGGYAIISAIPTVESTQTVISACVTPEEHERRPWTMGKSWIAFANTNSPSTVAYFYPNIDDTIKNSEIIHMVNNVDALFGIDSIPYKFSVPIPNSITKTPEESDTQINNINTGGTGVFAMDLSCNTWIPDCEMGTITKLNRNHEQVGNRIDLMTDVNSSDLTSILPNFRFQKHLSPNNIWLSVEDKLITTCFTDHIVTIHDTVTNELIGCIYTPPIGVTNTEDLYPDINGKPMDSQGRPVAAVIGYHGTDNNRVSSDDSDVPIYVLYQSFYKDSDNNRINSSLVQFEMASGVHVPTESDMDYDIYSTGVKPKDSSVLYDLFGKNIIDVTYYNEHIYILSEDYTGTGNAYFNNKGYITIIPVINEIHGTPKTVPITTTDSATILHPSSICITEPNPETSKPGDPVTINFIGYVETNGSVNAGVFKFDGLAYSTLSNQLNVERLPLITLEPQDNGNIGRYANNLSSYTKALNGLAIDYSNQIWLVDNISGQLKVFTDLSKRPTVIDFPKINNLPTEGAAYGDWNGSRFMLNYFHWEFAPHIFYGESEPFVVESYDNFKIRKHNDSWNVVERMKYASDVEPFNNNTNFFERYIGAALGGERTPNSYSLARKLYERIANSVANIHDVDECGVDELCSIGISQDVPMDMFSPHYPEELKRLMDLFSISHEKLWGNRCTCNSFFFEAPGQYNRKIPDDSDDETDYNPKRFCPICKHFHGTNLGPMISNTNEIKLDVDNHPPYVVRSRYNKRYIKIEPSVQSIQDAVNLLYLVEHAGNNDPRITPQYNAMTQFLLRIQTEKQYKDEKIYEKCPIWSSFLYQYGPVQTPETEASGIPAEYCVTSAFNEYYTQLEEINPLSSEYVDDVDLQLKNIYGDFGSSMKETQNLKEWITVFQQPINPKDNISVMPNSISRDLLIMKYTIDNLSTYHDKLVSIHTSMFTPEPWYNYCIYHYIPTQCGKLNTSVINWEDSRNTLAESVSGLNEWYQKNGIVESIFSYVIRKGLGFDSGEMHTYTIVFYPNGGTGAMDVQTMLMDTEEHLRKCRFRRYGYRFLGWSTSMDGKVIYPDGAKIKNLLGNNESIVLYAKWEKVPVLTITFNSNGGTGYMSDQEIPAATSAELQPNLFTLPGSGFDGWATSPEGNVVYNDLEIIYNPYTDMNTASTLYAKWIVPKDIKAYYSQKYWRAR